MTMSGAIPIEFALQKFCMQLRHGKGARSLQALAAPFFQASWKERQGGQRCHGGKQLIGEQAFHGI